MTRGTIVACTALGAAAVSLCVLAQLGHAGARSQSARPAQLAAKSETSAVPAGKGGTPPAARPLQPGEIRYASTGVSMLPAGADARPVYSKAYALATFNAQPPVINQFAKDVASLRPDIQLMNVTDTQPVDGNPSPEEYLGWVIIYRGVPPVFYGGIGSRPSPNASNMTCDLVGIQNAHSGEWTATFESCS
jgi:hypothetical protein